MSTNPSADMTPQTPPTLTQAEAELLAENEMMERDIPCIWNTTLDDGSLMTHYWQPGLPFRVHAKIADVEHIRDATYSVLMGRAVDVMALLMTLEEVGNAPLQAFANVIVSILSPHLNQENIYARLKLTITDLGENYTDISVAWL